MRIHDYVSVNGQTKYTNCDIRITIDGITSENGKNAVFSIKISDMFNNCLVKKSLFAQNYTQIELKVNRILYNLLPENELVRIHWSIDRSFSMRAKLIENSSENYEYLRDFFRTNPIKLDY